MYAINEVTTKKQCPVEHKPSPRVQYIGINILKTLQSPNRNLDDFGQGQSKG